MVEQNLPRLDMPNIVTKTANLVRFILFIILIPIWCIATGYTIFKNKKIKQNKKDPRIMWGPVPIVNIYYNSRADRKMGLRSDCVVYKTHKINDKNLFDYNFQKLYGNKLTSIFIPFLVMAWAVFKYDVFNFFYNGGFLYETNQTLIKWEFFLLKIMGKKVIVYAYGSDVRLESITRNLGKYHAYMDMTHEEIVNEVHLTEKQISSRLHFIMKNASRYVSMGDMTEYTPGSINDIFYWAIDIEAWKCPEKNNSDEKIIIVHAPNHPQYKGTRFLLETVERIKKEGYPIDLILIQKMENSKAKKIYEKADIVAEQFIIGWHGFFAIEAMALGKPVMCYIRKKDYLPSSHVCPIVNTDPDNLYQNLITLIKDKKLREKIGSDGRDYVKQIYSLEKVGARLKALYTSLYL